MAPLSDRYYSAQYLSGQDTGAVVHLLNLDNELLSARELYGEPGGQSQYAPLAAGTSYTTGTLEMFEAQSWVKSVLRDSLPLVNLPVGWDTYDSPPPTWALMQKMRHILSQTGLEGVPAPHVVPVPGGGIQLEWHEGTRELEIEFTETGGVEFYAVDSAAKGQASEGPLADQEIARIRGWLVWVSG